MHGASCMGSKSASSRCCPKPSSPTSPDRVPRTHCSGTESTPWPPRPSHGNAWRGSNPPGVQPVRTQGQEDDALLPYFWGFDVDGERLPELDPVLVEVDGPGNKTEIDLDPGGNAASGRGRGEASIHIQAAAPGINQAAAQKFTPTKHNQDLPVVIGNPGRGRCRSCWNWVSAPRLDPIHHLATSTTSWQGRCWWGARWPACCTSTCICG